MHIPPLILQTAGSLVAILALAGLAWWLKLGGAPVLDSEDTVRRAAQEVDDGFLAVDTVCDAQGRAALARDAEGRVMLIKLHGNRFAGRLLNHSAEARLRRDVGETALEVDPGEFRFGKVFLDLPKPEAWVDAINRLNSQQHA